MLSLKEQALNLLHSLPEEKMIYVVDMLKWVSGILDDKSLLFGKLPIVMNGNSSESKKAWERLQVYKGIIPYEIDAKAELASARDEKYADFV